MSRPMGLWRRAAAAFCLRHRCESLIHQGNRATPGVRKYLLFKSLQQSHWDCRSRGGLFCRVRLFAFCKNKYKSFSLLELQIFHNLPAASLFFTIQRAYRFVNGASDKKAEGRRFESCRARFFFVRFYAKNRVFGLKTHMFQRIPDTEQIPCKFSKFPVLPHCGDKQRDNRFFP